MADKGERLTVDEDEESTLMKVTIKTTRRKETLEIATDSTVKQVLSDVGG